MKILPMVRVGDGVEVSWYGSKEKVFSIFLFFYSDVIVVVARVFS